MADAETTTRAKRKRSQISYDVEEYFEDLDMEEQAAVDSDLASAIDDSDVEDVDFGTRKKPKKRARKPNKKKEKRAPPFRFMDLPAELRDEIYTLALTDSEIVIVSKGRNGRRSATRGTISIQTGDRYYGSKIRRSRWGYYRSNNITQIGSTGKTLSPSMLAVSKQMREEAGCVLYNQELIFADMAALHAFVVMIGPFNRQLLADVTIKGYNKAESGHNFAAFNALSGCTNLKSLFFDCDPIYRNTAEKWAQRLYRDGSYFFEAYGAANGGYHAAMDIIDLPAGRLGNRYSDATAPDDDEAHLAQMDKFEKKLLSLLG